MRRFRLRRVFRVNCEALMRAAGQNLKRLLKKWGWGRRPWPEGAAHTAFSLLFCFPLLLCRPLEASFWADCCIEDGTNALVWTLTALSSAKRVFQQAGQIIGTTGFAL